MMLRSSSISCSSSRRLCNRTRLPCRSASGCGGGGWQRQRQRATRAQAAPFDELPSGDPRAKAGGDASSSSSDMPPPAAHPASAAGSTGGISSRPTRPRALTPETAQDLEQALLLLLPQAPASTPLAPLVSALLPLLQPALGALPPEGVLGVLRLCNWAGAGHSLSDTAWLQAAALHWREPPSAQTACLLIHELFRLWTTQLPPGAVDRLFVAMLDGGLQGCSSSSIAGALAAIAVADLRHRSLPAGSRVAGVSLGSSSSVSSVKLAGWRSGYHNSGRSNPDLASSSELHHVALPRLLEELGAPERLAQLQPQQLAAVAAAAAALQLEQPAGWLDRLFAAIQQQLPRFSPPALALLATALPLLLPTGGNLRLWKQLGAAVQTCSGGLTAAQLCEVLPLVQAADLPLPVAWLQQAMDAIEAQLAQLSLPQSSRALVAAVALGHTPRGAWLAGYRGRLAAQLSELAPEGLVDVLRALKAADALPTTQWLEEHFEAGLARRWGFVGPVELSSSAFLLANLGHTPSEAWRQRFLDEALKFKASYRGAELTQLVWSTVRLSMSPSQEWLAAFVAQLKEQASELQFYQLAFTFAALQKLEAPMSSRMIDSVLDACSAPALQRASPSDTALLLATVARLRHVASYSALQGLLDHCQDIMTAFDGQELVTILWALSQLHHQPEPEWLAVFWDASDAQLAALSGSQLATLAHALAQLDAHPPEPWMQAFLAQCQQRMAVDGMGARDATSLLASLAALQYTPPEEWLHTCLTLLHWRMRELEPEGLATISVSLVKLSVTISGGEWLDNFVSLASSRLPRMSPDTQASLLSSLAVWRARLPPAWLAMFQLLVCQQAEEGGMSADQLEQVVVALSALGASPSTALTQHYYDASRPLLGSASPDSLAAVLIALLDARLTPDAAWLEAAVAAVRRNHRGYTLLQLNGVAKALTGFEAAGMRRPWLSDAVAWLREWFLH